MPVLPIPLISLFRRKDICLSCDKRIKDVSGYIIDNYHTHTLKWNCTWESFNSNHATLVDSDDGHIYDYKCKSCIADREYNMGNKYNKTHPQKEYMQ